MNRNKLKTYAPKARRDFIAAVTARAAKFGITKNAVEPVQVQGNVAVIAGQAHPKTVAEQRAKLEARIKTRGFEQVMEEAAYTWFNRFAAIRYMEVHGYLDHGYRVLSHPEGKATPEIVEQAQHLDLPGLDRENVIELKLDGTKEGELYRMLLLAQCNALHAAMPFLFERIDDETELLLPDNLLHSDSVIRQMVTEIDEADWQEIEIIGWLYQFYISEKKDQVIGKVVKSEDIPAATQLFTPNWIVKYMVQNTLGAKWLATYPQSGIRAKMEYYIEPAEQTEDVKEKLAEITPKELNPEEITFLDPACGSGHILVEAYDLFKEIYLERGYVLRDVPRLILEKNLFGLDIDDRAAQMAAFALVMKARADDRRILDRIANINVAALQGANDLDVKAIIRSLALKERFELVPANDLLPETLPQSRLAISTNDPLIAAIHELVEIFEKGKAFGSLTTVPQSVKSRFPELMELAKRHTSTDYSLEGAFSASALEKFSVILKQAEALSRNYDCVVANPPYMGGKAYNEDVRKYIQANYNAGKSDFYGCFILLCLGKLKDGGYSSLITIPNWMFLSAFEELRGHILSSATIMSLVHNGRGVFGSDFGSCMFTFRARAVGGFAGTYLKLFEKSGSVASNEELERRFHSAFAFKCTMDDFCSIPGRPIAYWASHAALDAFKSVPPLSSMAKTRRGLQTGDSERFIRYWFEVSKNRTSFDMAGDQIKNSRFFKWLPFNSGGQFRRWYGNFVHVVNWLGNGEEIKSTDKCIIPNEELYFKEAVTWSRISSGEISFRYQPPGILPGDLGPCLYSDGKEMECLALMNSCVTTHLFNMINPTLTMPVGDVAKVPFLEGAHLAEAKKVAESAVSICKDNWDSFEVSWDFLAHPLILLRHEQPLASSAWDEFDRRQKAAREKLRGFEERNNEIFAFAYGLDDDAPITVDEAKVSITIVDAWESITGTISYAIGCMMGRYSLDEPGLVYANGDGIGFDPSRYATFPADDDGIVPIIQTDWFDDDAANRFVEFVKVAWSPETLAENLNFIADSLGAKAGETPIDTIRRYLSTDFFKDHLKTYKKRPIYWLFSSGKEKAFEALVYLHRYNEGTLSRMRMEYVTPLQGRISARIDQLERDIAVAGTTAQQNKMRKEQEKLKKQQAELIKFDEQLRHYADMRIKLDLDDGVKVNYGKFGTLLAEVKAITGGGDD